MSFLLDTNAVSEWTKPAPDAGLVAWVDAVDEDRVYVSVMTIAELRHGIERVAHGRRRERLETWIQEQFPRFPDISVGLEPPVPRSGPVTSVRRSYKPWPSRVMTAAMS